MNGLKPVVTALLLATGFIAACTPGRSEPNDSSTQEAKVVQLSTAFAPQNQHSYQFPATVVPVKTVALNFEVSGRLDHVDMTQGARINKGHLLASVDDAPFERRVRTNRAKQKQARLELERIRSLFKKNLAAQRELDNAEVNAEVAQIALENSIQDLSYTQLVAPFDALISERLVEKDSFIGAGTAVVKLQDVSKIRFEINVSERVLSANIDNQVKSAFASVAGVVNHSFPVTYVEHTTQPDPITQTYKFLFEAVPSNEFTLYPGTRAYVTVTMNSAKKLPGVLIPITALVNRADGSYGVWLFNERSQRVQLKTVEVAGVEQNRALISSGLQLNDRVVSAGISQMSDDLLVQPYKAG